jgi:hypothetical protein
MFICYNTIIKLDLIIIIIQKYCEKYLKPDKAISDINKSKTIKFVLDQLNDIRKTKDFKVLKSIFTIEKKQKIKDLKDWLNILCANNFKLFSKHFNLDVEIDMTKGYKTYVNLLSKLGNNKTKVDLKKSNKNISILFNLLFYDGIVGGGIGRFKAAAETIIKHKIGRNRSSTIVVSDVLPDLSKLSKSYKEKKTQEYLKILIKSVKDKSIYLKHLAYDLCRSDSKSEHNQNYIDAWNNFIEHNFDFDSKSRSTIPSIKTKYNKVFDSSKVQTLIMQVRNKPSELEQLKYTFIYLLISWTYRGDIYIKTLARGKQFKDKTEEHDKFNRNFEILIDSCWILLKELKVFDTIFDLDKIDGLPHYYKYIIMLSVLANLFYYGGAQFDSYFDPQYKQVPVVNTVDPNNVVFYFGTNFETIEQIQRLFLPQSSSNSLKVANSFVTEVLAIYNFTPSVTPLEDPNSELWIPVPIRDYSHFPYEEEVLLVPKLKFLKDIINNENKITPEFINSRYKIKAGHYRNFIESYDIVDDSSAEDKIEDEIQIVHMSKISDIEERQTVLIEEK